MDDELRSIGDAVSKFIAGELVHDRERWDREGAVDRASWRKAGTAGLLCASIPAAYGGGGGTLAHELVVLEELYRAGLDGFGAGLTVHSGIVAHYLNIFGSEEQKLRWLPGMASGERIAALALTEPDAGSDLQAIRTVARREGDHYLLSGSKIFISNGQNADYVLVAAKTDPDERAKGISLILVETGPDSPPGFQRGRNLEKIGLKSQDTSELFFDSVAVPVSNLLGEGEGLGFPQLMNQLSWERLLIAFTSAVAMDEVVRMTTDYTKERKAFGKRIFDFQNTQFKLAEAHTLATIARTFVDRLVVEILAGSLDPALASMAKWWVSESYSKVADECLQLHGGYGYMQEYAVARHYTDSRISRIYGGSNEIMKMLIARSL
jgi:acyl-CoA dehydrogenase